MSNKTNIIDRKKKLIVYVVLTALTLAVFWQVNHFDFISFDDNFYITENTHIQSRISMDGIRWAFTTKHTGLWNPLIWISLMLDYQLHGLKAGGYHLTNLIFHILSTLLLFWLFDRMTKEIWKSAFVAALFALHPLHVESVAWIAERKDVLSAFFWMLTLCLYVYYTEKPAIIRYLLVLFSFALALLSKPIVITLPIIMILLDYWPLKRFEFKKDTLLSWQLKEKIPFFILSAALSIITLYSPYDPSYKSLPWGSRIANAPVSFMTYIEKIFWPHDMAVFYPFPAHIPIGQIIGTTFLIIVISAIVIITAKRLPYLFVGWLWYSITLLPVIGIIQISLYAMADHYSYLSSIGISVMLAWGVPLLFPSKDIRKIVLFPTGIAILLILSVLTWQQCSYWRDSITLLSHALQVTTGNYIAHGHLGGALFIEGKTEEAIDHYNNALRITPGYTDTYNNRGTAYYKLGRYQQALADYNMAIRLKEDYADAYNNRGIVYSKLGLDQQAIEDFSKAIHFNPIFVDAYNNRVAVYAKHGQYQLAINDLNKAIAANPDYLKSYINMATIHGMFNQYHDVVKNLTEVIRLQPDSALFYFNRGFAYAKIGQYNAAINDFDKAIQLKENYADAYNIKAAVYLNQHNIVSGCDDAKKACELGNCSTLQAAAGKGLCL